PQLPPPTDTYTLSLHDALPIYLAHVPIPKMIRRQPQVRGRHQLQHFGEHEALQRSAERSAIRLDPVDGQSSRAGQQAGIEEMQLDRKSTRLNSSHVKISYAVFC